MVSQNDLTRPQSIITKVPAPNQDVKYTPDSEPPDSGTIEIRACSEFTEYAAAVNHFSTGGDFKSVQGFRGNPQLFAIGKDGRLNCLIHEAGAAQGWIIHDISPSTNITVAFDVFLIRFDDSAKNLKAGISLVAATQKDDNTSEIYTAFISKASLLSGCGINDTVASDWSNPTWTLLADPKGGKDVTTVLLGIVQGRKAEQSATVIWVGTRVHGEKAATFYAIDLTPNLLDPWVPFAPDTSADEILGIQPATTEGGDGLFVFSGKLNRSECMIYTVTSETLERHNSQATLQGDLGKINAIYSSKNPWNYTDLVFACEQGVGFVNYKTIANKPIPVSGLPKIGFRQVVCSEKVNTKVQTETSIVMFAVSDDNELYYIQGARHWSTDNSIYLTSSGLPIRKNVSCISCQYNQAANSSELVYTTTEADEVKHLIRDPNTTGWSETNISFPAPTQFKKYHAFVTTISLRNTRGHSLGEGFPVEVSSESMHILANDSSYRLSSFARTLRTDSQGQLVLVAQASDSVESAANLSLKAPVYNVRITRQGSSHSEDIQAGQRVIAGLQKLDSPEKLAGARSTTGEYIFRSDVLQTRRKDFEGSARMLSELPWLLSNISGDQTSTKEIALERENTSADSDDEEQSFLGFIGDAIEWLRSAVKTVAKVVIRVVARGIKFVLTVGTKLLSLVVDTAGQLLSSIGDFLKSTLGINYMEIFKMLGLMFDPAKIKENQKILEKTLKTALKLPSQLVKSNMQNIDGFFDLIEAGLKPHLGNKSKMENPISPDDIMKNSPLAWIFDNPVMNILKQLNPLSILTEAFTEEFDAAGLGDTFEIPQFRTYLTPVAVTLWEAFKSVITEFLDLIKGLWSKVSETVCDPSKAMNKIKEGLQESFWFLFNTMNTLVKTACKAVGDFMDGLVFFLEAKWKFPLVTTLFEWHAEQDFTLLNLFTFSLSRLFGVVVGDDEVAKYIDPGSDFDSLSQVASNNNTFSGNLKEMKEILSQQQGTVLLTNSLYSTPPNIAEMSFISMASATPHTMKPHNAAPRGGITVKTESSHQLSKDGKSRIHQYEKWAKIITTGVGIPRMISIYLETAHLMAEIGLTESSGHDGPNMALPIFTIITTSLSLVGSVSQMCNWLAARSHSDEVKQHLDHNFASICAGVSVGFASNLSAVGFSVASYFALRQGGGDKELSKNLAAISGVCLCIGTYGETIGVHLVPAFRSNEPPAVDIALGFLETIGTTGGLVALGGGRLKDPETMGVGVAVDGLCTFVSTLTGAVLILTEPVEGH